MSRFMSEYLGTIAIGLLLAVGVAALIASMIRGKRKGKSASCGCGCANCPHGEQHGEHCGTQPSSLAGNGISAAERTPSVPAAVSLPTRGNGRERTK
jgi:hypothetical protein